LSNTCQTLVKLVKLVKQKILLNVNKIFVSPFCTPHPAREREKGKKEKSQN
jgi:hypothetical protein